MQPQCPDSHMCSHAKGQENWGKIWALCVSLAFTEHVQWAQGHCWVEGDNAEGSLDSATELGPLPLALVEGCVLAVCWPRLERVPNRMPPGKLLMRSSGDDVRVIT